MDDYKGPSKVLRRELDASAKLKVHESSANKEAFSMNEVISRTSDISSDGFRFYSPINIPDGTNLEIELESGPFYSDKKDPIRIVGKVTSSIVIEGKYQIVIQFIEISNEDKEAIRNYLQG